MAGEREANKEQNSRKEKPQRRTNLPLKKGAWFVLRFAWHPGEGPAICRTLPFSGRPASIEPQAPTVESLHRYHWNRDILKPLPI
jgi:hypothetical protein